ncbi:MAG: REP-associated tyrosine transposase, partial [Pikeienuella sp.]
MSNYRRLRIQGGTYFFTVTLADRRSELLTQQIDIFRSAWAATHCELPFYVEAAVILPDHLHTIWTLPDGDADFSERWRRLKGRFSRSFPADERRSWSKRNKGEMGLWQRRFWEHAIRDEEELAQCKRYCWYNPVKHGLVDAPVNWQY